MPAPARIPVAAAAVALAAIVMATFVWAANALGGSSIRSLSSCPNSYMILRPSAASERQFQAAMLCLVNAVRTAEKLPAFKLSVPLDKVAQAQSDTFARTGSASHGSSITDIAKRFGAKGYRPAAYDEGFDDLPTGATPYWFASAPAPSGGTVTVGLKCEAKVPCVLTAVGTLPDAGKATASTASPVTIPAGKSVSIPFTFTGAQVSQELKSQFPIVSVQQHVTAPVSHDNKLAVILQAPKG